METKTRRFGWLRRVSKWLAMAVGCLVVLFAGLMYVRFHDRHPGTSIKVDINGHQPARKITPLRVGFSRANISPTADEMSTPIWLAGFSNGRAATNIHDDLWAVACVVDDGNSRIGFVALDAIGFFHDDSLSVRAEVAKSTPLDYAVVCSTHNHSTPDLMGLWGKDFLHTGVHPGYRARVIAAAARAMAEAAQKLEPASMALYEIPTAPDGLVTDTRRPVVYDPDLRLMLFHRPDGKSVIGSIVAWANHPETPWGHNQSITADFPGYLRDALENGIIVDGQKRMPGLGGTHLYINGAIGGLMTTSPNVTVRDPFLEQDFKEASHAKTLALGRNLAKRVLTKVASESAPRITEVPFSVHAKTVILPMDNDNFVLAGALGLIDRGHTGWRHIRSEVALLEIGEASITCIPGEIYPELVNGGVVRAEGGDYDIEPLEVPSIRELVPGRIKFICGLANDEIGYIIPKSEWDEKPPHLFGAKGAPYGEVNSLGPETAHLLHTAIKELAAAAKP
ncbi:MAG TPA: hypothetical protein VMF06_20735 [Candidatus Limnocylindria bacterium]|jgi:hypothetical protein|nr:hypothetical protein [Candidatus Limnocylindria bacterium]